MAHIVIGVIVAVMAGGWGYVILAARGNPEARAEVISFEAEDPARSTIVFTVHKPFGEEVVCRLRAVDEDHVEVGTKDIRLPPGRADFSLTEQVKTSALASSLSVQYCHLV